MLELAGIVIGAVIALSACVLWWLWQLWQTLKLAYHHLPVTLGQPRLWLWLRLRAAPCIGIVILRSAELAARAHAETLR
jgi:hypothetical protein